jgi:pimeloyl-ACP methyl ester carboxylesterase
MTNVPFRQLRYDALPEIPTRAHRFFELEERRVVITSPPFGDVEVSYREHGSGKPLLLIHGLMTTGYSWRYLVDHLHGYQAIMPDLVGCGRSGTPRCSYSPRDVAAFIAAFARAIGVRGCPIVGNSMGGYLAMRLALDDPEATSRVSNIHSPGVPIPRMWALAGALAVPGARGLLSWIVAREPERWAHARTHYYDETLKSREEAREYGAPLASEAGRQSFVRFLADTLHPREMQAFERELRARRFPVPLQLLFAKRDVMVPPAIGERLRALVPDARFQWLEGCSHFAHVDRPDLVAAEVRAFLDEG